ncbi:hypothetical protein ACFC0S_15835 [Streptomyces sp. NPDC056084]|uniref:hypothetical protein n=1 Tax=unclassified Streptomyces TaxID=2593676 RepID=UPI0035DEDAEE
MTQTLIPDTPVVATTERNAALTRLNGLLHRRGWSPDLHVMFALRAARGRGVPMLPDWSQIDTDWTFEDSVVEDSVSRVFPTLLGVDEDRPEQFLLTYPYSATAFADEDWCPAHRTVTMTFPLTHRGVDVLEQLLPAIEGHRVDGAERVACLAPGCSAARTDAS